MSQRVITAIDNHVATVTLNRAGKKNAADFDMFNELISAADSLAGNPSVRAVVLHGDGDDFCAGIDISVFAGEDVGATTADLMKPQRPSGANFFQSAAHCWRELPVPVIAALHGAVFGAGLQIALGADLRIAHADARLSIMEIKWGIIPDLGISATLPDLISEDRARELCYTGRMVSGSEALALGPVTEVAGEPLERAHALAAEIAGKSPDAIRATKRLINGSWRSEPAAGFRLEAELQTSVMATYNQKEAAMANLEKRAPVFRDPE